MAWYEKWFGEDYLELYSHRDAAEARQQVDFVLGATDLGAKSTILDVACGRGRHARELATRGYTVFGVDRSAESLRVGQSSMRDMTPTPTLIRGDMRHLPFEQNRFDLLLSMFTSFGYFETDAAHQALLTHWHSMLRANSFLFIDYLNRDYIIETLVPETTEEKEGRIVTQRRRLSDNRERVVKDITIENSDSGETSHFVESVRMYSEKELSTMLETTGFHDATFFGDFNGTQFLTTSPRLLVLARSKQ